MINEMFGFTPTSENKDGGKASRLEVYEAVIEPLPEQNVQQRVTIDRWTGGALDTGLFAEAPLEGGEVELRIRLRAPQLHEVALLLQVWKDLWMGDLPLGGEASVGRGKLKGKSGEVRSITIGKLKEWSLAANGALENPLQEDLDWFTECQQALSGGH